jgi:hypothetical protein
MITIAAITKIFPNWNQALNVANSSILASPQENVAFLSNIFRVLHEIKIQGSPYEVICITATVRRQTHITV